MFWYVYFFGLALNQCAYFRVFVMAPVFSYELFFLTGFVCHRGKHTGSSTIKRRWKSGSCCKFWTSKHETHHHGDQYKRRRLLHQHRLKRRHHFLFLFRLQSSKQSRKSPHLHRQPGKHGTTTPMSTFSAQHQSLHKHQLFSSTSIQESSRTNSFKTSTWTLDQPAPTAREIFPPHILFNQLGRNKRI